MIFLIATLTDSSQQGLRSGFGYVVGLFLLLVFSVTSNAHGFYRSYTTGVLLRGALMHVIYRGATTQLSEKAKLKHGLDTGKLMSLISADVTRVDFCCGYFHVAWTSIFQMLLCFALTVWTMGYSALPRFGLLALLYPLQSFMMGRLLRLRWGSMPFTDARVKAVIEAVATIRLVKTNAYEESLLSKIGKLRSDEVVYIRKRMLLRALNTADSCFGRVVFSGLAYFMLLRTPLQALPTALSAIADARAALVRLALFMLASDVDPDSPSSNPETSFGYSGEEDEASDVVIKVEDANFAYHDDEQLLAAEEEKDALRSQPESKAPSQSQRLLIDSLLVRRNHLACIVGAVASGKTSGLKALLGDMHLIQARSFRLSLTTSSSQIALAPHTTWLLSETVRENIVFGSQLLFLDDCFSALDAHVGARVFDMVVNQARRNNEGTIVLVTHSIPFARQADHIVYMEKGRIAEQGSFEQFYSQGDSDSEIAGSSDSENAVTGASSTEAMPADAPESDSTGKQATPTRGKEVMQTEERVVSSVGGRTYIRYARFGNAWLTCPLLILSITIYQGTSVVSPLWLSWWQKNEYTTIFQDAYMGGYAAFGAGQSLGLFYTSATFALFLVLQQASSCVHVQGRITHRLSKDVDAVDNVVGETLRLFISTFVQVLGTIIVVSILASNSQGLRRSPSSGGVVLSYIVTAQAVFGNMIHQSAEIENNMNSVERMLHYAYNIEQEPAHQVDDVDKELKARQWPHAGHVQFQYFTLSHRPGLDPALKDVNLDIRAGEKVGIVGRTGAGKTTQSTFTPSTSTSSDQASVISQDAVLLAGTIRYNLDPFQQYDGEWLQQYLDRVGLGQSSKEQDKEAEENEKHDSGSSSEGSSLNLDLEVKENGSNISQGQRSLISIARALVRKSKIVILDEATASIDGRADAKLQSILNEVVGDATVLTVAHRLDTIAATCYKVVVMDSGRVVEFDTISELYASPGISLDKLMSERSALAKTNDPENVVYRGYMNGVNGIFAAVKYYRCQVVGIDPGIGPQFS
ncbi:ABC transporter [Fusarium agapanthi]|uniref:ABC transporter n=1 Tax=Fusarium agapanthi TaxID=1803897 RepID=A0A9P5AXZ1_9HYPO|nr:ABC transporter [Fusarium agapanthi]